MGVVLAQVQRMEKSFSHVKVGLHDAALEAPSLLEGAGIEMGQERHPPFVFLMLWSRAEDEDHSLSSEGVQCGSMEAPEGQYTSVPEERTALLTAPTSPGVRAGA